MSGLVWVFGSIIVVLFVLNWLISWRRNETDRGRGPERWQGWDDGHGGEGGGL